MRWVVLCQPDVWIMADRDIFGNDPLTSRTVPHTYCTGKSTRYGTSSLMSYIVYRRFISHQFRMGRHHQRADRLIDARPSVSPVANSQFRKASFSRALSFLSSFQIAQSRKAITRKPTTIAAPAIIVGRISVVAYKRIRTHWTTGMRPRLAKAMKRSRTDKLRHICSFKHTNAHVSKAIMYVIAGDSYLLKGEDTGTTPRRT